MQKTVQTRLGNFLYENCFPVYNIIYPYFKFKQDAHEIELLNENIKKGDIVCDIGANIGFYTKIISRLVGIKGYVHAFEPDKKNFEYLQRNCFSLANVSLNPNAVSEQNGTVTVYVSDFLNVDHRTYEPESYKTKYEMPCVSIDSYLQRNKKVDFIKMDIQGFEMFALKGMKQCLEYNHQIKLLSELWPYGLQKSGSSVKEFADFLFQLGFQIFLFTDGEQKLMSMQDLLALPVHEEKYFNIYVRRMESA
ncbi:MAG: FkbM family methyltransferase [Bacteroidetes bacterium]|nr:FkbM family methyltransferase [Bacteroidota bacterium]